MLCGVLEAELEGSARELAAHSTLGAPGLSGCARGEWRSTCKRPCAWGEHAAQGQVCPGAQSEVMGTPSWDLSVWPGGSSRVHSGLLPGDRPSTPPH